MRADIEKNIIIRCLKNSDIKNLLNFVKQVNGEEVAPTVNRLLKYYPNFPLTDNFIVFDNTNQKNLAYLCLLRGNIVLNGIRVPFGQIEIVGTDPEHRHKSYIKKLNEAFEKRASEYELTILFIEGIPYFYRQFGYEYAINSFGSMAVPARSIPKIDDETENSTIVKKIDDKLFELYLNLCEKRNKFVSADRYVRDYFSYLPDFIDELN